MLWMVVAISVLLLLAAAVEYRITVHDPPHTFEERHLRGPRPRGI